MIIISLVTETISLRFLSVNSKQTLWSLYHSSPRLSASDFSVWTQNKHSDHYVPRHRDYQPQISQCELKTNNLIIISLVTETISLRFLSVNSTQTLWSLYHSSPRLSASDSSVWTQNKHSDHYITRHRDYQLQIPQCELNTNTLIIISLITETISLRFLSVNSKQTLWSLYHSSPRL